MPSSLNRALRISTGLVVVLSFVSLTTVSVFGTEVVLIPVLILAVMPLLEVLDRKTVFYRKATTLVTAFFTVVVLPLMLVRLMSLVALTILCMYIQAYLLLHQKKIKDYHYIFLMAFFLLVSACAQSPEPSFGLVAPLFTVSIVWAFAMLQIKKDGTADPDLPIGELLPVEERNAFIPTETLRGPRTPRLISGALVGYLFGTAVSCIVLALGIFLITPRMEAGVFGGSNVNVSRPEATETVDLSVGGRIGNDLAPVMRVRFISEPEGEYDGPLFWRVTTLNRFVGSEWDRVPMADGIFNDRLRGAGTNTRASSVIDRPVAYDGRRVVQEIYLDDPPPLGIPCLPFPVRVETRGGTRLSWDEGGDLTVVVHSQRNSAIAYKVRSVVPSHAAEELRQYPARYAQLQGERDFPFLYARAMGRRAYSLYTQEDLSPRSRELARQIVADFDNPYDQAEALIRFFRESSFVYTLSFPSPAGEDPIDTFLHVTRSGHCELYATAMALMLRSLGIPTRVVSGYRGGEWDSSDGAYVIRKNMAHLWVEVYFIGQGWVTFDPAPEGDLLPESQIGTLARFLSRNLLRVKMMWFRDVVGYEGGIRLADLRDFTLGIVRFDFDTVKDVVLNRPLMSGVIPRLAFWVLILFILVCGTIYAIVQRPVRSRALVTFTADQVRATRLFGSLKRRLGRLGTDCTGKTAGEVYAMLLDESAVGTSEVDEIVSTYWRTRFGGRPLDRRRYLELSRLVRQLGRGKRSA